MTSGARRAHHLTQDDFAYRFDWGLEGLTALAPQATVVIIVDVLRFTSAVSAAVEGGGTVFPYPWAREGVDAYAAERTAIAAGRRDGGGPSLSPTDLLTMPNGARIVLPSPNGAALACAARDLGSLRVLAGCLRNATATAHHARHLLRLRADRTGGIAIIAAGERWDGADGPLRPAVEDLIGAGAILAALDPSAAVGAPCCSPEAAAARSAFQQARPKLFEVLCASGSGKELLELGWEDDVATSAALDVTITAAELIGDAFVAAPSLHET
ncbi:unannotated protein [freshwater metagenome]|uniref:2-phosphosulfolactate phosphatase n=1 Tax=freshwater metagenome TaxID=449393 RepID=A0A6J7FTK7_9ZZZZ|nr:hypothetical protein [Actinomycetota bacterium]